MSRYIDADALKEMIHYTDDFYETPYVEWEDIVLAPTVDAVPVVRCKDCKWFDGQELCDRHGFFVGLHIDTFFCADGERRTE